MPNERQQGPTAPERDDRGRYARATPAPRTDGERCPATSPAAESRPGGGTGALLASGTHLAGLTATVARPELARLQHLAGNRAVTELVARRSVLPRARLVPTVQREDLKDALGNVAGTHAGGDVAWLEQVLTDPGNTAESLAQESPEAILENLQNRNCHDQSVESIKKLTFEGLLKLLLQYGVITQSCGQTAALVHGIVSPSTLDQVGAQKDLDGLVETLETSSIESMEEGLPWYVRVEGGGHAFVVEVSSGKCRIYQSFFGTTTLASDMQRDSSYSLSEFTAKLKVALTPSNKGDTVAPKVLEARRSLFASQAVHPDGKYQVQAFPQEEGMGQRLADKYRSGAEAWAPLLSKPATDILAKSKASVKAPVVGDKAVVSLDAVNDGDSYLPVKASELEEERLEQERAVREGRQRQRKEYSVLYEGHNMSGHYIGMVDDKYQFEMVA